MKKREKKPSWEPSNSNPIEDIEKFLRQLGEEPFEREPPPPPFRLVRYDHPLLKRLPPRRLK